MGEYSYDVQNRRVYRKADEDQSGSQETELYYVLDGNRVIEERVYSDEDLKRDYWYGVYIDSPIFARCDKNDDNDFADTDEQFYYLHNTQYSVHALTDTSGSIIEVYKNYHPYGAVEVYTGDGGDSDWWDGDETTGSLSSNYYLFTGRRYDPEADLMFYRNRMYSTSRGRFLQRDPIDQMEIPYALRGYQDGMNLYRAYFVPKGVDTDGLTCGSANSDWIVPDEATIWGVYFNFTSACAVHDVCYGTCGMNKLTCDRNFYDTMKDWCENQYPTQRKKRNKCKILANTYYAGVRNFAKGAYCSAQIEAKCCPLPKECWEYVPTPVYDQSDPDQDQESLQEEWSSHR